MKILNESVISQGLSAEEDPNHLFSIRSYLDLPNNLEFDAFWYYTSPNSNRKLDSYTRMDLRLAWKPTNKIELSLVGQNLLEGSHREFDNQRVFATEVERSFYGKVVFRF